MARSIKPSLLARLEMLEFIQTYDWFKASDLIRVGLKVDGLFSYFDVRQHARALLKNAHTDGRLTQSGRCWVKPKLIETPTNV
jgi:hypothetical protein